MEELREILGYTFLGNTLGAWALAVLAFLFTFLVLPTLRAWIRARRRKRMLAEHHYTLIELLSRMAARTSHIVLFILALYLAEKILTLPRRVDRIFDVVIIVGAWYQVGLWATAALRFFIERKQRDGGATGSAISTSMSIIMFVVQIVLWSVFILLALDNLGVNITALVAGLGVGGIAVALAVQTMLGDLFASLSIAFDKPFQIGDNLKIDDYEGTVEHIGLKSTRLRSITGEQIIVANADALKSRVRNMGRMSERRLYFKLYLPYDTDIGKLDAVPEIVTRSIKSREHTRFVQCLLTNLGAYAMEFECIWFVATTAGVDGGRIVDGVNRSIIKDLAAAGIRLTYPTQRVLHRSEVADEGREERLDEARTAPEAAR